MVNEKRMRETFEELVRIYAPSKGERDVCDLLKKKLKALGVSEIIEDNNGSVEGGGQRQPDCRFSCKCRRTSVSGAHGTHGLCGMLPGD